MWYVLVKSERENAFLGDKINSEWKDGHLHRDVDREWRTQVGDIWWLWGRSMDVDKWVIVYGFGWWVGWVMIFFKSIRCIYITSFKKIALIGSYSHKLTHDSSWLLLRS